MLKIISVSSNELFQNSLSSMNDLRSKLEDALTKACQSFQSIVLWNEKNSLDPSKLQEINKKFQAENLELATTLSQLETTSPTFKTEMKKYRDINQKLTIFTDPEMYLLALKSMQTTFEGNPIVGTTSIDLIYPRIFAARYNKGFTFPVADKKTAERIFNETLIPLDKAEKLYGTTRKTPEQICIICGGAATRYKKILTALSSLESTDPEAAITEQVFQPLRKTYDDIALLFTTPKLAEVFDSPMFHSVGITSKTLPKNNDGDYLIADVKTAAKKVVEKYKDILKAMDYGYEIAIDGQPLYVNYFLNKYLNVLSDLKEKGIKGSTLYLQLDNQKNIKAFEKMTSELKKAKILQPEILDVKFMDEKQAPVLSQKTGQMVIEKDKLKLQPTGHGPAYISAGNFILADKKSPGSFSVQTIDNSGKEIPKYITLSHNANELENEFRDKLIEILRTRNLNNLQKLLKLIYLLSEEKYGSNILLDYSSRNPAKIIAELIEKRWDFKIDPTKDIIAQVQHLPISVDFVTENEPGKIPTGGGLFIHKDTKEMAIVDNKDLDKAKEQEKKGDFVSYFNPMLFTTYIKKPMTPEMEKDAIFVAKKGDKEKFLKGESASTHIATLRSQVLKRIIVVPFDQKETVIVEHKNLGETYVNLKPNKIAAEKLTKIIQSIAKENAISEAELAEKIWQAQEAGRTVIVQDK